MKKERNVFNKGKRKKMEQETGSQIVRTKTGGKIGRGKWEVKQGEPKTEGKIGVGGDCKIGRGKTRSKIHGDEEKKKKLGEKMVPDGKWLQF